MHAAAVAVLAFAGAPAFAGADFTAVTHGDAAHLPKLADTKVRGHVDGDKGRLDYLEGGLGSLPKGSSIVTTDGARSAKLYNTANESCGDAPPPGLAPASVRAAGANSLQHENVRVEKTLDEAGPKLHGVATRHLRYAIAYDSGGAGATRVHTTTDLEVWVAPALSDAAYALWLNAAPHTGDAQTDGKIAASMKDAAGAALKRVQRTTLALDGSEPRTSATTMEVTALTLHKPSGKSLAPPFTCRLTPSPK